MAILDPDQRKGQRSQAYPDKVHTPRSGRLNRGPRKQVFVCGVAKRSEPVRQDECHLAGACV